MAVSTMYGIPQIISFKWCTMCSPRVVQNMWLSHGSERVNKVKLSNLGS